MRRYLAREFATESERVSTSGEEEEEEKKE